MAGVPPVDGPEGGRQQAPVDWGAEDAACQPQRQHLAALVQARLAKEGKCVFIAGIIISQDYTETSLLYAFNF